MNTLDCPLIPVGVMMKFDTGDGMSDEGLVCFLTPRGATTAAVHFPI